MKDKPKSIIQCSIFGSGKALRDIKAWGTSSLSLTGKMPGIGIRTCEHFVHFNAFAAQV